jgi:hypothetical protein
MPGAEAAIARADERGLAAGAFAHGNFLGMAGDRPGAQAAWRRARRLAVAQADPATRVAAQRALHPPAATWLRAHRLRTLLLAIGLVTIGVFVAVPAAVAVLLALVAVYAWHRPLVPGSPMNAAPIDSGTGLNIGGLSVSGDVGVPMEPSDQATAVRPASLRDTAYARMLPVALGGAAIVFAAWAARAIDIDRILRGGSLAYALTIVWLVAWAAPSVLAPPSGDEIASPAPEDEGSIAVDVAIPTPVPFSSWTIHIAIGEPRLMPLVDWVTARRRADAGRGMWIRKARGLLSLVGWLLVAAFFAAMAVVPAHADVLRAARDTGSALIAMSVLGIGVGRCLVHAACGVRDAGLREIAASVSYLIAVAAVFAAAWWLGLLGSWLAVLRWIF